MQPAQIRYARLHHFQLHFNEVILHTTSLGCCEDFFPVESVLSNGHDFSSFGRPALDVHRHEAAWILGEVVSGVLTLADGRNLKLKLDQLWI